MTFLVFLCKAVIYGKKSVDFMSVLVQQCVGIKYP